MHAWKDSCIACVKRRGRSQNEQENSAQIKAEITQKQYEKTLDQAAELEMHLVQIISTYCVIGLFGSFVPILLLLAPLYVWTTLCVLRHNESAGQQRAFGQVN